MNLSQLLLILRARRGLIVTVLLITVLAALVVSLLMPKVYKATTSVVVDYKSSDPVTGLVMAVQGMPGYLPTQVAIIESQATALKVIDRLKLADNPALRESFNKATDGDGDIRDWLATILLGGLTASPSNESSVIDIAFKNRDPRFAALVANAFAEAYQQVSVDLKVDPSRQASEYFTSQLSTLRNVLEQAQSRLSKYQQDNGIVGTDDHSDFEIVRLNDLSTQLVMAQSQSIDATSRRTQPGGGASETPDVASNPLIQGIKSNLVAAEARFAQVSQRLAPNHPDYKAAEAEVQKWRSELASYTTSASTTLGNNASVTQRRVADLQAAVDKQKARVLEVNRGRDQMSILTREVESAQRAYEAASQRFNQTNLEGQSRQSSIAVLTTAFPPSKPSSPRLLLNLAAALVMGCILGVAAALLLELMNRRIRSASDLMDIVGIPVLGVVTSTPLLNARKTKRLGM